MVVPKIYADFQNLDDSNRLILTSQGTLSDLERLGIELCDGLHLIVATDDEDDEGRPCELLTDAVVRYDPDGGRWVAAIDWSALRYADASGQTRVLPQMEHAPPRERRSVQSSTGVLTREAGLLQFIKFMQPDPDYKVRPAEVVVSVGQIVKIEPRYFETSADDQAFLKQVTHYGEDEALKGVRRQYIVYDSLGNVYNSEAATEEGRTLIEKMWMGAV